MRNLRECWLESLHNDEGHGLTAHAWSHTPTCASRQPATLPLQALGSDPRAQCTQPGSGKQLAAWAWRIQHGGAGAHTRTTAAAWHCTHPFLGASPDIRGHLHPHAWWVMPTAPHHGALRGAAAGGGCVKHRPPPRMARPLWAAMGPCMGVMWRSSADLRRLPASDCM